MKYIFRKAVSYFLISTLILLSIVGVCGAFEYQDHNLNLKLEGEYQNDLKAMTKNEFFNYLIQCSNTPNGEAIISTVPTLLERKNEFSNEEIISIVENPNYNINLKSLMIELYSIKNPQKSSSDLRFRTMLTNDSIEDEIKNCILMYINLKDEEGINILSELAKSDNEKVSPTALKMLEFADLKKASEIADIILKNYSYDGKLNSIILRALNTKSRVFSEEKEENHNAKEVNDYIRLCDRMLQKSSDENAKYSIAVCLANMNNKDALEYVIKNTNLNKDAKAYTVRQNTSLLNNMLKNKCSDEDICLIARCMNFYPIEELYEPLKEIKKNIKNDFVIEKINNALISIENIRTADNQVQASGEQGKAIYRDGVPGNEYHAAMVVEPQGTYTNAFVHIGGPSQIVKYVSYNEFLNKNNLKGKKIPRSGIDNQQKNDVVLTARALTGYGIGYSFINQMRYDENISGYQVKPADIISMRCDGVVEYCYEYHGLPILPNPPGLYWDISRVGSNYYEQHSVSNTSPTRQYDAMIFG